MEKEREPALIRGTNFVVLCIVRYKSVDVNILGSTHSLGRKSRRISV